ncbi:anti-sigma factor antagonist [Nonomuraea sp. NPDC051941]|uniref:anti-sigma factor antagonist n=1 Tax=Nonomuraea sp. NPDC051941 TaxID=3364373 RepID=UPI0037C8F01C
MGGITLRRQYLAGVTIIMVSGELDLATADELEEFVRRVRRAGDEVVMGLAGTSFMDCTGLNALLHLRQEIGRDGGTLRLVGLQREPIRVLRLSGMDRWLPTHDSLEQALTAATGRRHRGTPGGLIGST